MADCACVCWPSQTSLASYNKRHHTLGFIHSEAPVHSAEPLFWYRFTYHCHCMPSLLIAPTYRLPTCIINCYIACLSQVVPSDDHHKYWVAYADPAEIKPELHPDMLLVNAVARDHPDRTRLVEMLLQRGVPLESVPRQWADSAAYGSMFC
jgi:hypothetical protein